MLTGNLTLYLPSAPVTDMYMHRKENSTLLVSDESPDAGADPVREPPPAFHTDSIAVSTSSAAVNSISPFRLLVTVCLSSSSMSHLFIELVKVELYVAEIKNNPG